MLASRSRHFVLQLCTGASHLLVLARFLELLHDGSLGREVNVLDVVVASLHGSIGHHNLRLRHVLVQVQHLGDDIGQDVVFLLISFVEGLVLEPLLILNVEENLVAGIALNVFLVPVSLACSQFLKRFFGQGFHSGVEPVVALVSVP